MSRFLYLRREEPLPYQNAIFSRMWTNAFLRLIEEQGKQPNLLFAAMHLFSYANWGAITVPYVVISFVSSELLGLLTMGCIFQFLKEKSGTLWMAVLVHAILVQ